MIVVSRSSAGMETHGHTALVLSGGGARGAYQAGVLQGLIEIGAVPTDQSPFSILVGTSAGSLTASILASNADRYSLALDELISVWHSLRPSRVFRTDLLAMGRIALSWVRDLSLGGLVGSVSPKSLLDTRPLRGLLSRIPFHRIQHNLEKGSLRALAVSATDYRDSSSVLFVECCPDIPLWERVHYRVERALIGIPHLMASSAIPFFFPTIEIDGHHLGDGCIRNTAPLAPAIHLGAEKILAIGVREPRAAALPRLGKPTPGELAGALLDAVMMDAIEVDVQHCQRVNASLQGRPSGPFRPIEVLWLRPTRSFATLAHRLRHRIPKLLRYFLAGLGGEYATAELASYLLFDPVYCRELVRFGREDVWERKEEILEFFIPPPASCAPRPVDVPDRSEIS